jgi:hypothetical protein
MTLVKMTASTLQLLMQLNHATYRSIVEVRTVTEPMISQLTAQRIIAWSSDNVL